MRSILLVLVVSLATASASRPFLDDLSTLAARQLLQTTSGSVYAVCPDKCDVNNGKCTFDSSNAGYKSIKCLNNMVVIKGRCACPAGRYLDVANSRCLDCPLGAWCPGGIYDQAQPRPADNINQPISTNCTNGLITRAKRSRTRTQCLNPPGSYFSTVNVTGLTCTATEPCAVTCPVDTFTPGLAKQRACTPCPTGFKTRTTTGATNSQACMVPPGYYLKTPGQVAPCPRGEYQSNWVASNTQVGKCTPCGVGITTQAKSAAKLQTECSYTQAGYAPLAGDSATPTYITEAVKCPQNFYCPGGQVSLLMDTANPAPGMQMMPCNVSGIAGLWTQGAGATSIDECMVPPGYGKAVSGSTTITQCSQGSTGQYRDGWLLGNLVNTDSAICQTCGSGIKGVRSDEVSVYTYNTTSKDYDTTPASVASSSGNCYIDGGMGMYYIAGSQNSLSSYRASTCLQGNAQYGVASVTYGLAANPCKPCPSGLTITSSSATGLTDSTSGGITDAAACVTQAGWGWDGRISTECPKGSWAVGGDLSPCTECGFGQTTANTGSVSVAACALAEGYGAVSGVIQLCPIGSYNDQDGVRANTTACTTCPVSKTSTEVGAVNSTTDCDACPYGMGAPLATADSFKTSGCNTCTSGTYGPNRQSVDEQPDQSCVACPISATGFQFFYNGTSCAYQSPAVSKSGATVAGDCLSQFAQITDGLWYFGGATADPSGGPTAGDASIAACAATCTGSCQFVTYDYNATSSRCKLYSVTAGTGATLAYKAVPSGDIYAAAQSVIDGVSAKSATPSGLYTQWLVDISLSTTLPGQGTPTDGDSTSKESCFNSCDSNAECAAVFWAASPATCKILKGVSTPGATNAMKRTLTRAVPSLAYLS